MIGYITIGTNNFQAAQKFYDALFEFMGIERAMGVGDSFVAWGRENTTSFCITRPYNGGNATPGNGVMVALAVGSKSDVDRFHEKAIQLGATSEGDPGPRKLDGFYAGYIRDLDGNKLNIFTFI